MFDYLKEEIIFNIKPNSNIVEYDIESQGLNFEYQKPLTTRQIKNGTKRPEDIVGSYAVFDKYKNKKFHIYRPYIQQVNNDKSRVWCDLHIDTKTNTMTITIPEQFYSNTKLPWIIDPTFGYTTIGASSATLNPNYLEGFNYTAPSSGTIDSISIYCYGDPSNLVMGVYDDSSTYPNNLLTQIPETNILTNGSVMSWHTINTNSNPSITSGNTYWISFLTDNHIYYAYDDLGKPNPDVVYPSYTYSSNLPATFPSGGPDAPDWRSISLYVTYTESGGGSGKIPIQLFFKGVI